jgi:hypothetical protein
LSWVRIAPVGLWNRESRKAEDGYGETGNAPDCIVPFSECFETLTVTGVPDSAMRTSIVDKRGWRQNAHQTIQSTRHDQRRVSVKVNGCNIVEVRMQCLHALSYVINLTQCGNRMIERSTSCNIPYPYVTFASPRHEKIRGRIVVYAENPLCVSFQMFVG